MKQVVIRKYDAKDEYVVFFKSDEKDIKILTATFEAMGFSVKDRGITSVTLRGTMEGRD